MHLLPRDHVGGGERGGDDGERPFAAQTRAALSMRVWPIPSGVAWLTKKSRASGSASASQVRTLIPRSRALRSTDEIPCAVLDGDGDDVDAAGDPGVDDLVLLGRVGVGRSVPDELDSQLVGGLLGPLAAVDEIGVPLALGHHGHRDRLRFDGRRGRRRAVGVAGAAAGSCRSVSDWTRTTLLTALIRAAARMAAQITATCEFFTVITSEDDEASRRSAARRGLTVEPDGDQQERSGQVPRQARREGRPGAGRFGARRWRRAPAACRARCRGRRKSTSHRARRP